MKKIWYQVNPELLSDLKNQLATFYPSLHIFNENGKIYIRGNFPIKDKENQKLIDEFKIEIEIPNTYPLDMPLVRETGGKIPKTLDRHFFYPSRTACLFLPEERYIYFPETSTIFDFIEGPVKSFFISQVGFATTGKWPFGERSHDESGIIDYYYGIIGTNDELIITRFIYYLSKEKVKGHWLCYCGSGEKMRKCHFNILIDTRKNIKPRDVLRSLWHMANKLRDKQQTKH